MSKGLENIEKAKARTGIPINQECAVITATELEIIEKELKTLEILQQYFDISLWEEFDTDRNYAYISVSGENRQHCASKNISADERVILREVLK